MRARRWIALAGATAVLASIATTAHANGRIPEANQLVVRDDDPDFMLLRATFGLLVSTDRGKSWDWICESAVGYGGAFDPAVALVGDRTTIAGTFNGLVTSNGGCSWKVASEMSSTYVVDVTATATRGEGLAMTNFYVDGGYDTGIFRTTDGAKSWTRLTTLDPTLVVDTVEIAKSEPSRMYVTAKRFGATTELFLLESQNGGSSFTSHAIALDGDERGAFVCGVDPKNANRVYVRTLAYPETGAGAIGSRLLVSDDGGQTFVERFQGAPLLGFALSQDGTKAYLGLYPGGLQVMNTQSFTVEKKQSFPVKCLTTVENRLYACSDKFNSGFVLGVSSDDGTTFSPVLQLESIRGPLSCAAGTEAAKCAAEWPQLAATLGVDAGTTPPAPPAPAASSGCGCSAAGTGASAGGALASLFVGLSLLRRRLRPRSRPSRAAR